MSDLISRQAAISAICNACGKIDCDKMDKCEKLQLPPANCSEFPNNSDIISRQAAIDVLGEKPLVWDDLSDFDLGKAAQWSDDVDAIKELPSAQPQLDTCPIYGGMCGYPSNLCYECPRHEGAKERPQWWTEGLQPFAQPQWIPVTERLPERGKDVLVTRDYDGRADHIKSCRYVEVASCYGKDDDVSWNSYSDEYKMTPKNHRVVAWMSLPEPYKGEQK